MTSGFIQLPRSLLSDKLWKDLPYTYRHVYLTILSKVVFKPTIQDDFGVLVHLKPGQYLTTERELARLCDEPDIDRCVVQRALKKFFQFGFSIQTSIHKKTIITITREDICELIDPNFNPNSIQTRSIKEEVNKKIIRPPTTKPPSIKVLPLVGSDGGLVGGFSENESQHKRNYQKDLKKDVDTAHENYAPLPYACLKDLKISSKDKSRLTAEFTEDIVSKSVAFCTKPGFPLKKSIDASIFYYCKNPHHMVPTKQDVIKHERVKLDNYENLIAERKAISGKIHSEIWKLLVGKDRDAGSRFRVNCECVEISNDRSAIKVYFKDQNFKNSVIHNLRKHELPIPDLVNAMP